MVDTVGHIVAPLDLAARVPTVEHGTITAALVVSSAQVHAPPNRNRVVILVEYVVFRESEINIDFQVWFPISFFLAN